MPNEFNIKNGIRIDETTIIDQILDDDTFTSNSATALATQQSIKAYVDNAVSAGYVVLDEDNMISDRDDALATQQSIKAYVDNNSLPLLDEDNMASNSATSAASQQSIKAYVDGLTYPLLDEDNMVSDNATSAASQQSIKAYVDGLTYPLLDEDNMSSNSAISAASQQSIKAYVDNLIIDEDNMASDSNTHVPTQQSVKAYIDNKTINYAQTLFIPASSLTPPTSASTVHVVEYSTYDVLKDALSFNSTMSEAQFSYIFPADLDIVTGITAKFIWSSATGSTTGDGVVWGISAKTCTDNEIIDSNFGTEVTVTDTLLADNGIKTQKTNTTAIIVPAGSALAGGKMIDFKVRRLYDHASDTMTEDAYLFAISLHYTVSLSLS